MRPPLGAKRLIAEKRGEVYDLPPGATKDEPYGKAPFLLLTRGSSAELDSPPATRADDYFAEFVGSHDDDDF